MAKVIFINRYYFPDHSATSQLLTDLTVYLAARRMDIHVVTSRQRYDNPAADLPTEERHQGVTVHRVQTSRLGRTHLWGRAFDYLTFYMQAIRLLFSLVKAGDYVVAETDPPLISVCAGLVCHGRQAHLINWVQDLFPEVAHALGVMPEGIGYRMLRRMRNWSLHLAVLNVVLGHRMEARLRDEGVAPTRIRVIHNWADGSAVRPVSHAQNPLRQEWHLADSFVVGYSGNMGRAHEFETVLAAAERVRDRSNIVFLFIGDGAQRQHLEADAQRRGLTNICFRPYQPRERLAYSLSAADVHLVSLAPTLEGLIVPSKFYGIAAAGRATLFIGDAQGEVAHLIRRHACGASVAVGDAEALATHIRDMAEHPEATAAMGRRARTAFDTHFEMSRARAAWETELRHLLGGSDSSPVGNIRDDRHPLKKIA
ncbi:MAG: glycosyltransferase family 4 protein [Nitrospiraceae bacterium]